MTQKPKPRSGSGRSSPRVAEAVTLDRVAQAAGVSASTVSRILNGTAVVAPDKAKAVEAAIARLGFVPNPMARALAGGRTNSVGVITQSIDSPFYGVALRGIEDELGTAGYSALFVSGHWNEREESRCIETLRSRLVDGIIVLTGRLSDADLSRCAAALPVVVTGRDLTAPRLCSLSFDNVEGARMATEHLLGLGHRRIAFITGDSAHPDAIDRLEGYRRALAGAGIEFDPALVVPGLFHEESGLLAIERLLASGVAFTAVFAANDQMALGACLGLYRRGLKVPDDVSVVGFDDIAPARYALPPLTSVHHPAYELGVLAARAMLQMLEGHSPDVALPPPRVIPRESSGPPRQR